MTAGAILGEIKAARSLLSTRRSRRPSTNETNNNLQTPSRAYTPPTLFYRLVKKCLTLFLYHYQKCSLRKRHWLRNFKEKNLNIQTTWDNDVDKNEIRNNDIKLYSLYVFSFAWDVRLFVPQRTNTTSLHVQYIQYNNSCQMTPYFLHLHELYKITKLYFNLVLVLKHFCVVSRF